MLTGKQRSYLRALANNIQPIFQIGKGGINDNLIKQFSDALEARELVKATVLKNSIIDAKEACLEISEQVGAETVQIVGNKFILYKESKDNKVIVLPE
jgi:RNA-binding protein